MLAILLAFTLITTTAPPPDRAVVARWDLDGDLTSASGAPALRAVSLFRGGAPKLRFERAAVDDAGAEVATVRPGTALAVRHALLPNGGGRLVNAYTLIVDLRVLRRSRRGFVGILQTHGRNVNQAEWGIDLTRGVGGLGSFGGAVRWDRWYRLALVVDPARGTATSYLDGEAVAAHPVALDGRYALEPEALLFADDDLELGTVQVNAVELRDGPLSAAAVAALGGPTAAGPPAPSPPLVRVTAPAAGAQVDAASVTEIRWETDGAPHGQVRVVLLHGERALRELATVPVARGRFAWHVDNDLPAGDDLAVRLEWLGPGSVTATSGRFTGTGGDPARPPDASDLVHNGRFEAGLDGWTVQAGAPALARGDSGGGGSRVLRGGPGDFRLVQEIPLAARGFDPHRVDLGLALDASVRLRARERVGRFDDQAWLRVAFLGADGQTLGATRSLMAAGPAWRQLHAPALIPAGTRAIRVEVEGRLRRGAHNDASADDVSVVLRDRWPRAPVTITKAPLLYGPATGAVTVLWEADLAAAHHVVRWREVGGEWRDAGAVETQRITDGHAVQRAVLGPLVAGGSYEYEVRSDDAVAGPFRFAAAPAADASYRVSWLSDNQDGYPVFRHIVAQLAAARPSLAIFAGDLVQHGQLLREWQQQWFGPLSVGGFGQSTPIVFARGNHDGEHDLAYAYSALPGNEAWYAFTHGRVRYVFLDTEAHPAAAPAQAAWLKAELASEAARAADFRVVVMHKPPFTNFWDRAVYDGQGWIRAQWVPQLEAHGVDLVVAGHAHGYMRLQRGSTTYLVIGGGGGELDTAISGRWEAASVARVHHYAVMDASPGRLSFTVRGVDGAPLDSFELRSRSADDSAKAE
ncbi:MAG: hypothetical protein CVU56_13255 [Deltaproteobacteria bacterium HGW-Deltaproteobacteria-14]|jgi:predicted phosphodiesterase|nr:MAG: hypothetical protein CVU56_13255 [Deltaproteobacteria bacterium HGW-Deltaproteobacteria-14]